MRLRVHAMPSAFWGRQAPNLNGKGAGRKEDVKQQV